MTFLYIITTQGNSYSVIPMTSTDLYANHWELAVKWLTLRISLNSLSNWVGWSSCKISFLTFHLLKRLYLFTDFTQNCQQYVYHQVHLRPLKFPQMLAHQGIFFLSQNPLTKETHLTNPQKPQHQIPTRLSLITKNHNNSSTEKSPPPN